MLTSNDIEELANFGNESFLMHTRDYDNNLSTQMVNYYFTHPSERSQWQLGIRATNGKLVGYILGVPKQIHIKKEIKTVYQVTERCNIKYLFKRLRYILIKEFIRRANLAKIN